MGQIPETSENPYVKNIRKSLYVITRPLTANNPSLAAAQTSHSGPSLPPHAFASVASQWALLPVAAGGAAAARLRSSGSTSTMLSWVGAAELGPRGKFRYIFTAKFTAYCR